MRQEWDWLHKGKGGQHEGKGGCVSTRAAGKGQLGKGMGLAAQG